MSDHVLIMRMNAVLLLCWFVLHDAVVLLGMFTWFGLVANLSHETSHFAARKRR